MEKTRQEFNYDLDEEAFSEDKTDTTPNEIFNQLLKCADTCALTCLLKERHALNFIEEDLCYKLSCISEKLYRFNTTFYQLTAEEQDLWNSFDISDIMFFLSGQRECAPDYSQYLRGSPTTKRTIPQPVGPLPPFQPGNLLHLPLLIGTPAIIPPLTPGPVIQPINPFINPIPGPAQIPFINLVPGPAHGNRSPLKITARAARYLTHTLTGKHKKKQLYLPPQ